MLDIPVTFAVLLGRPWFHPLGGVPSTLHQKIKFPYEGKIVTISAESEAAIAALKLALRDVPLNPGFEVCMIYKDSMEEKVMNMLKRMNFILGMGLGKDQTGPPEYVEAKLQILKHGLGYQGEKDGPDSERKWTLWEKFVKEGNYTPYERKLEPVLFEGKKILGFEIFADCV